NLPRSISHVAHEHPSDDVSRFRFEYELRHQRIVGLTILGAQHRRITKDIRYLGRNRLRNQSACSSPGRGWFGPAPSPALAVLTILWNRFSPVAVILIVRIPNRPSRPKTISTPSMRRKLCARRNRPASARGLLGQPDRLAPGCKRSDALPLHCALSAMISRTSAATGSVSTMFSIAARRLFE